eukprot:3058256-Prorocentrum_lima.AAC.1
MDAVPAAKHRGAVASDQGRAEAGGEAAAAGRCSRARSRQAAHAAVGEHHAQVSPRTRSRRTTPHAGGAAR